MDSRIKSPNRKIYYFRKRSTKEQNLLKPFLVNKRFETQTFVLSFPKTSGALVVHKRNVTNDEILRSKGPKDKNKHDRKRKDQRSLRKRRIPVSQFNKSQTNTKQNPKNPEPGLRK